MASLFRTKISGVGSYLPTRVLTNPEIEKLVETTDAWITERTGIVRRHVADSSEATTDLAYQAALKAFEAAKMSPEQIDLIIFATVTGDQVMPSSACVLQQKLGCRNVMAFDLSAACSGFLYSLSIADQFIRTGMYQNILVIGAEVTTRFVNYQDRDTCILFGDGGGAWIVSRANESDTNFILSSHPHAEGQHGDLFTLRGGGSRIPFSQQVLDEKLHLMTMKGREIFKNAVRTMATACREALDHNGMTAEQVDWIVPHQANNRILEAVADQLKFPKEQVISYIHETGNTSAASIPIAFDMAVKDGKIKRGQTVLLTAFGAGLTSGSLLLKY